MWRMFKEIGTYGDVGYGVTTKAGLDASTMPLDPILKPENEESGECEKLAGCAKVRLMRACAMTAIELSFCLFAMAMLLDDHHEPWWVLPTLEKVMTVTAPKWVAHIDSLLRGVLEESSWNELKCPGAYFGIPKTEELHDRRLVIVFQPATGEQRTKPLFRSRSGSMERCQPGRSGGHYYRWKTAPMGMLHSPYECMGIGLCVLLWKEADEEELVFLPAGKSLKHMKPLQSLPTYIEVKGGGFICLYYDNQLTCCVDPAICEKLRRRIQRNQELFGLIPKPRSFEFHLGKDLVAPKEDLDGSTLKLPVYLGAALYSSER